MTLTPEQTVKEYAESVERVLAMTIRALQESQKTLKILIADMEKKEK